MATKITIPSTATVFGQNTYAGNFGNDTFPIHPIAPNQGDYYSTIKLNDENVVSITLYFYTDSVITAEDISLYAEGANLYVDLNKAQNPTPTDVTLWKLTGSISDTQLGFTLAEKIELYCQNPVFGDGMTDDPKTSRGTKVAVKSGTGEF
ncbi:hypothetical protein ACOSP6_09660 [Tenacibaculum sp. MEBiC06402]|uniref:hypothetical protein n=1 Tax=unclassified Tenacibaculum TaxID=2635139 RepID=UPI003B9AE904